jgi:hypothetical protein
LHPLSDNNDACTRALGGLCFPHLAYNLAATACRLEDISNMPDSKTNGWKNKLKKLIRVALEQQAESSAS